MTTIGSNVRIRYESRHKHPELGHIPALRLIPIPPLPSSPQSPHSGPANPPLPTRLFSERAPSPPRHLPPTSQSAFLDPGRPPKLNAHTSPQRAVLHRCPLHRTRSISERAPYPIRRAQLEHTLKRFPDPRPERIPAAPSPNSIPIMLNPSPHGPAAVSESTRATPQRRGRSLTLLRQAPLAGFVPARTLYPFFVMTIPTLMELDGLLPDHQTMLERRDLIPHDPATMKDTMFISHQCTVPSESTASLQPTAFTYTTLRAPPHVRCTRIVKVPLQRSLYSRNPTRPRFVSEFSVSTCIYRTLSLLSSSAPKPASLRWRSGWALTTGPATVPLLEWTSVGFPEIPLEFSSPSSSSRPNPWNFFSPHPSPSHSLPPLPPPLRTTTTTTTQGRATHTRTSRAGKSGRFSRSSSASQTAKSTVWRETGSTSSDREGTRW